MVTPAVPILPSQSAQTTASTKADEAFGKVLDGEHARSIVERQDTAATGLLESKSTSTAKDKRHEAQVTSSHPNSSKTGVTPNLTVEIPGSQTVATEGPKQPTQPTTSTGKQQRPGKLDLTTVNDAPKKESECTLSSSTQSVPATPMRSAKVVPVASLPATPATATSQMSSSSVSRPIQPRTIRVVQTPKSETSACLPTASANPMLPPPPVTRQPSRQPSVASINQPGTPLNETISDNASLTSRSHSRQGSPAPSKVGSAPVRLSTKSQQKKDRQARARLTEESSQNEEAVKVNFPEEPVQAPIIGRKKKAKKAIVGVSAESTPLGSRPTSPRPSKDVGPEITTTTPFTPTKEPKKTTKASKKETKKDVRQNRSSAKEPDQLTAPTASKTVDALQKSLLTAASIFADLQKTGDFTAHTLDLFRSVPGINHRFDFTESDFAESTIFPTLTESQRQLLEQGKAICAETGNDKRVVILPDRRMLRGFTSAQALRYIELRNKNIAASGPGVFNSARYPIESWIYATPQSTGPFDGVAKPQYTFSTNGETNTDGQDREAFINQFINHFDSPMTRQGPMATNYWAATGDAGMGGAGGPGEEAMQERVALMSVEDAERMLMEQRKETEALEKRLNGLLKKNRRLLVGSGH